MAKDEKALVENSSVMMTAAPEQPSQTKSEQAIPANVADILAQLKAAFDYGDIGLVGRSNNNGADYYECTSCLAEVKVKGYATGNRGMDGCEHDPKCRLMRLHKSLSILEMTCPALFAE